MAKTRREALIGIAGSTTLAAQGQHVHHLHEQTESPPGTTNSYSPKVFTAAELRTVGALTEVIIPKTSTPGALDAKVHEIIDQNLAANGRMLSAWRAGLKEVSSLSRKAYRKEYTELNEEQQVVVMTTLAEKSKFFDVLKGATVDAYYSTREGLQVELGYQGAVPLPEFKGCTHPEHQS